MADGKDEILDEIRGLGKGSSTAVAEPDEKTSILDEIRAFGQLQSTPTNRVTRDEDYFRGGVRARGARATQEMISPDQLEPDYKGPTDLPGMHFDEETGDFLSTAPGHRKMSRTEVDAEQKRTDADSAYAQKRVQDPFELQPTPGGKLTERAAKVGGELPLTPAGTPENPQSILKRNSSYAKPGPYVTELSPEEETGFQSWVKQNKIPFDPSPTSDYDMRGFWKAQQAGDENAKRAENQHFPDTWKTPFHKGFSNESQYATKDAPEWKGNKLVGKDGSVVLDEDAAVGTSQPHAVRGKFGEPINPISAEGAIAKQRQEQEHQAFLIQQAKDKAEDERQHIQSLGPIGAFAVKTAKNVEAAMTRPPTKVGGPPMPEGMTSPAEAAINFYRGPGTMRPALEEFSQQPIERAALESVSELLTPDNLMLAASMETLPPGFVASAAGKVILGSGFTIPMAVGLVHQGGDFADAVKKEDWQKAAEIGAGMLPNIAFTAEGLRNVYEGITQGVNITKNWMRARDMAEMRRARATAAQADRITKLPEQAGEAAATPARGPEPSPEPEPPAEPEAPPEEPEPPAPPKPARRAPRPQPVEEPLAAKAEELPAEPEKRKSAREITGPDMMKTARANLYREQLKDKDLEPRDRAIIESQLDDLLANRFEPTSELGDLESMKAPKPKMTREEAEAASEERTAGREARFAEPEAMPEEPTTREVSPIIRPSEEISAEEPTTSEVTSSSLMENPPPGGFTEADKVPSPEHGRRPVKGAYPSQTEITFEGTKQSVPSWKHSSMNGLAVTKRPDGEWTVTHEGSGKDVLGEHFSTSTKAFQKAQIIQGLTDWTQDWTNASQSSLKELRLALEQSLEKGFPFGHVNYEPVELESGTLSTEEESSDVEPTETDLGTEQQPVGEPSEGPLETVLSEDVRGPREAGPPAREGGGSGRTDAERPGQLSGRGPELPGGVGSGEGEVPVPAERGGRAELGRIEPTRHVSGNGTGNNYRITERDNLGSGGERTKYRGNVAAIRTLKLLESEGRLATPEEQQALVKYVGWGGIASNQLFNSETKGGKNWATEHEELKTLLSEEEYTRARASTVNAHYTSAPVISGIWDALRLSGFRGGNVLEPSAGVGHFLGLQPGDLADASRRTAVELDPLSGRILKQLYQSADVRIQNYGDFKAPNDHYDVAVGNVPFGKLIVNDPDYNKHKLSIHNYFILKTLDKLRPGGIAALITSAHTMDSQDSKHRELFANRADLIGAIRLPNTAFKGNAGTEVTTDILFFKKREPGEKPAGESFAGLEEITSPQGNKIPINEYFAKHPEMMLGDMELAGTMRRAGEPALVPRADENLADALGKAVARLPENSLGERKAPDSTTIEASADAIPDWGELKQYGLKVKNGKVFRRIGDAVRHEPDFPKKQIQVLKEMLGVRDTARELLQAEAKDRAPKELSDLRRRLNDSYDRFIRKNGMIHSIRNRHAMHADPDLPLLLSLEDYDKEAKTATKAAIFRQRVVSPTRTISKADNAKDAMLISLAEKGRLDFDRMAGLTGKPAEELQSDLKSQGLVFEAPDGHWETSDRYLSGNVRKKLVEAQAAAAQNDKFRQNVEALRAVIPETVPPSKISMRLGSSWIPNHVIRDFVGHVLGVKDLRRLEVTHDVGNASWDLEIPYGVDPVLNRTKWGTQRAEAAWLLQQGLNQRTPMVWDEGPNDTKVLNQQETTAAQQKLTELHEELKRWVFEDSPHADGMADLYNELLNSHVDWNPDGSHLTFPGMNPEIQMRPWQRDAVWRAIAGNANLLLAHEVGLGKTYILGAIAMEWRRLGLKNKPVIVFPTHLVGQNSQDIQKLYPMANLLVADKDSFETMNRKEFLNRIATGDWDAIIVGDSQFNRMPPGAAIATQTTSEMLDTARSKLEEAKEEGDRDTVKNIETQISNFEAILQRYEAEHKKDDVTPFDELGVDGMLVDEAHRMKSLPFPTKMGRVRGVPQTKSQRAMDTYIKAQHITRINNGSGVVFATGTPITNTIAEAWILMKFLDEGMLKELGMQHFDSWAANFGNQVTRPEGMPEDPSKLRMVTRFAEFNNVQQLTTLFRRTADVKFASDVGLERPKMVGGKMQPFEIEPSADLTRYIASLVERAKLARGRKPEPGADNMLVITGDGRKAAIDMRMVDANAPDDPDSKLNQAAQSVAEMYHNSRDRKLTQLVGLDLREGAGGFDAYVDIRNKLIRAGIPKNEIAFIQDYKSSVAKQGLFAKVNKGEIAVVLGSSDTLGVGVNIQKLLHAMHLVGPPYRPDMVEQMIGRGIRWGNTNKEVLVRNYVTQKSFDAYMWHILSRKADFIRRFLTGDPDLNTMQDVGETGMNYAEIQASASGDQRLFQKIELESKLQRLETLHAAFKDQQFNNRAKMARLPEQIATTRQRLDKARQDRTAWDNKPEKFAMIVKEKHFSDRKEAGAALNAALQGALDKGALLGEYAGFKIYSGGDTYGAREGYLRGQLSWDFKMGQGEANEKGEVEPSPMGTIQSLERIGTKIENAEKYSHEEVPKLMQELEDRQEQAKKKFDKQDDLDKANKELAKLNEDLGLNKAENKNQDDGGEAGPEPEEPPDDLTQSFLGLQNIYNRIERAIRRMRARRAAVAAAYAGVPPRQPPRASTGMPDEPEFGETRGKTATPGEKAINIRLDKLDTADDVIDLIRNVARENEPEIQRQRRGKISHEQLKKMAAEVGLDAEQILKLKKGTAFNPEEILAARGIMLQTGEAVQAAKEAYQKEDTTENLLRFRAALERHQAVQKAVSGLTAEAGRALNQFKIIAQAIRAQKPMTMDQVLKQLGGRELNDKELRMLGQIPEDDKVGFYKFLRDHQQYTTAQKVMAYWLNNILSGAAIIHKLTGDAITTAQAIPMRFVRASVDPLLARMQRRPREFFLRDAFAQNLAYLNGIGPGVQKAAFVLWNGFDESDAELLGLPRMRYELPGGLATNWPTRILGAATSMFKTMHYIAAIHGIAVREALKENLSGKTIYDRAAELVEEPTDEMVSEAWDEADRLALIEKPGEIGRRILSLRNWKVPKGYPAKGLEPFRFIMPFVNIGVNIVKTGFRYSPAGAFRFMGEEARKTSKGSTVLAEAAIGSMIAAALMYWYLQGNLTGAPPRDVGDRERFYREGKIPFGLKIGNTWIDLTKGWGSMGLTAAAVSAYGDAVKNGDPLSMDTVGHVVAATGKVVEDQSFFRGLQNVLDALGDPAGKGQQFLAETASGMVPFSGLDRLIMQQLDPTVRDPQGMYERIQSGLPVLSRELPPRLDIFGEPQQRTRGIFGSTSGPLTPLDAELSRLHEEGMRNIGKPGKKLPVDDLIRALSTPPPTERKKEMVAELKRPLSRSELAEYEKIRGGRLKQTLTRIVESPIYKELSDGDKINDLTEAITGIEKATREQMVVQILAKRLGQPQARQQPLPDQPVGAP